MLDLIYGRSGTGKSDEMIRRAKASENGGRRVFILVPDRDAVSMERRASTAHVAKNTDVVTFRRLSNYIFRSLGGICRTYVGSGAKKVIMHGVLEDLSPELYEYGTASRTDTALIETLVKARGEMMRNKITPSELAEASEEIGGKTGKKLSDLSRIFAAFDREISEKWEDPDGMISAAAQSVGVESFFSGCDVYIDAFSSFTAQQYDLVEKIMRGAERVCVSLAYEPDEDKNEPAFMTLENTDMLLRKTAEKAGVDIGNIDILRVPIRTDSEALGFLSSNLWSSSRRIRPKFDKKPSDIKIISAADPYSEAEAIAVDIMKKIHGGMRYRDVAVIARSTEEYSGVTDAVFDKYEIPYFISEKTDITELSLIKFILCAQNMCERGFVRDELISYIKTDLCGISPSDAFKFENYIIKWNVSGKRMLSDFAENPRGIGVFFTEEDERELSEINRIRETVTEPLKTYFGVAKNASTVKEHAAALFDHLSSLGVPERLSEMAALSREAGDVSREETLRQLWRAFCDALDSLVTSVGGRKCDVETFRIYLTEMLSETDIGRIPTSIDEVLIADAVLTDVEGAKAVYVIGCNDGIFPKRVGEDGIFTEREKEELFGAGVEISSRLWKKLSDELYYFHTATSAPSDSLTLTYSRHDTGALALYPSMGVKRVLELFPKLEVEEFEKTEISDLIYGERASFEYAVRRDDAMGSALREYYSSLPEYSERLKYMSLPLSSKDCSLGESAARELLGTNINMSPSRLENYVKCRFAYFCNYELRLSDDRAQKFSELSVGTFMHKIMEIAVRFAVSEPNADEEKINAAISNAAKEASRELLRGGASARIDHIMKYLCKSAAAFVDGVRAELAQSKFRPLGFELEIGGDVEPLVLSDGGVRVKIRGKIDRVDAYESDGGLHLLVSDYKSGKKKFDMANVSAGLDMQMLLYLFSLWENGEKYFGKKTLPAGVVYVGIEPPELSLTLSEDPAPKAEKSGLFLADVNVLGAMDKNLDGEFIPVTMSDVASYEEGKKVKNLASLEAFEKLKNDVSEIVLKYAGELVSGKADAVPSGAVAFSPCNKCRHYPICRNATRTKEIN